MAGIPINEQGKIFLSTTQESIAVTPIRTQVHMTQMIPSAKPFTYKHVHYK